MTKVCPDPQCEAVYHNCEKNDTRCIDCGGWIVKIDNKTFKKKFATKFFQYNRLTGDYLRLSELNYGKSQPPTQAAQSSD